MRITTQFVFIFIFVSALSVLGGCRTHTSLQVASVSSVDIHQRAQNWLAIYAGRSDWEALLDCYTDDMQFVDQRLRMELDGKQAFAEFYDWPDERFRLADPEKPALVVHQLVVEGRSAAVRGRFLPFYWGEAFFEASEEFVFWLEFDEQGKIIMQRDYIPYPKEFLPD